MAEWVHLPYTSWRFAGHRWGCITGAPADQGQKQGVGYPAVPYVCMLRIKAEAVHQAQMPSQGWKLYSVDTIVMQPLVSMR